MEFLHCVISQTSFHGKAIIGIAKYWLFSQAIDDIQFVICFYLSFATGNETSK